MLKLQCIQPKDKKRKKKKTKTDQQIHRTAFVWGDTSGCESSTWI